MLDNIIDKLFDPFENTKLCNYYWILFAINAGMLITVLIVNTVIVRTERWVSFTLLSLILLINSWFSHRLLYSMCMKSI